LQQIRSRSSTRNVRGLTRGLEISLYVHLQDERRIAVIDLSICSVSYHNATHLRVNWHLARRLNADSDRCRWIIAENTPEAAAERLDAGDPRFEILPGASSRLVPNYQHTEALHHCIDGVDTRFMLILDPDFYLVRPGWIGEILARMVERRLSFFGVPWHPRTSDKYHYFPCVHCLFIDLERVPKASIDLRPGQADDPMAMYRVQYRPAADSAPVHVARGQTLGQRLWQASGLQARRKDYSDTGTRLYHRYVRYSSHTFELAQPVLRLPEDSPVDLPWRGRLLEALLPDELCYLPKRRGSCVPSGLREQGRLGHAPPEWEEFMWQGQPFGFHVRRNLGKMRRDEKSELEALVGCIDEFSPGVAAEALHDTGLPGTNEVRRPPPAVSPAGRLRPA
jgi:hypothetical protein